MAHTDHHTPAAYRTDHPERTKGVRHSLGVSLASRAAGPHFYRDEVSFVGGKTALRRRVRRTGRHASRIEFAAYLR